MRGSQIWRGRLRVVAIVCSVANVLYAAVFLLWPYFGAHLGSGVARWELIARLVGYGFWLSAIALVCAALSRSGKYKRSMIAIALCGLAFWFYMQLPVADFYAVEDARQHAAQQNK